MLPIVIFPRCPSQRNRCCKNTYSWIDIWTQYHLSFLTVLTDLEFYHVWELRWKRECVGHHIYPSLIQKTLNWKHSHLTKDGVPSPFWNRNTKSEPQYWRNQNKGSNNRGIQTGNRILINLEHILSYLRFFLTCQQNQVLIQMQNGYGYNLSQNNPFRITIFPAKFNFFSLKRDIEMENNWVLSFFSLVNVQGTLEWPGDNVMLIFPIHQTVAAKFVAVVDMTLLRWTRKRNAAASLFG